MGPPAPPAPLPYYVVWVSPDDPELLGVHKIDWEQFKLLLPNQSIVGSRVRDGKKFSDVAEAVAYYNRRHTGGVACRIIEY